MFDLKTFLRDSLGTVGAIIYFLIMGMLLFIPLFIIDTNFIVSLILIYVMLNIPFVSNIVSLIIYIWSLVIVLNGNFPIVICVIYYISLAVYILTEFIPTIIALFSSITKK